ncbi:hypothetical protein LDC_2470 [sediment metagenome]|uniref:Uncharacterized protein n=1 Tax=sediment metagenome TaxID=749907 RepID=D9PLP7_9ZZZZ
MELFSQHPEIPYGIIVVLMAIVSFLFKRELNKMDELIKDLKDSDTKLFGKIESIKGNYLDKFDEIKDKMGTQHDELIKEITKLTVMVEKQSTFCQVVQDMKKNK